jgi:biotin/methionine sulfoxide reductase
VRAGWLERGGRYSEAGRGAEPFVAVSWERALDLAAREIDRVRHEHGNASIFAGSYGWASAGRLHHAPTVIHRLLTATQPKTRLHAQLDCGEGSQASKVGGREPIVIHPQDAAARGIRQGDVVRVWNDRGACLAGAVLSDRIRPRVVQLATGAWYDPLEPGSIGTLEVHGNPNVLTRDAGSSKLAQGPTAHTTLVEIERFAGEPPGVKAFEPPAIAARRDGL